MTKLRRSLFPETVCRPSENVASISTSSTSATAPSGKAAGTLGGMAYKGTARTGATRQNPCRPVAAAASRQDQTTKYASGSG